MQKRFTETYNKIFAENNQRLEQLRKNRLKSAFFIILLVIVTWVLGAKYLYSIGDIAVIITLLAIFLEIMIGIAKVEGGIGKEYRNLYKQKIIKPIVEAADDKLFYDPNMGMPEHNYRLSNFPSHYDVYTSEDYITGNLEDGLVVEMSQVRTQEWQETTDSDGHSRRELVTTFCGIYGYVVIKENFNTDFSIFKDSRLKKFDKSRIEIDSAEFEEKYDCFAMDKIRTMQILTSDVIERFMELSEKTLGKKNFKIRCTGKTVFFQISNGDIFEANTVKKSLNMNTLYGYYNMIDFPIRLARILEDKLEKI